MDHENSFTPDEATHPVADFLAQYRGRGGIRGEVTFENLVEALGQKLPQELVDRYTHPDEMQPGDGQYATDEGARGG